MMYKNWWCRGKRYTVDGLTPWYKFNIMTHMKIIKIFMIVFCELFFCISIHAQQNFNRSYYYGKNTCGIAASEYQNQLIGQV